MARKIPGDGPTAERMRQAVKPTVDQVIDECIQRLENIRTMHHETLRLQLKQQQLKKKGR